MNRASQITIALFGSLMGAAGIEHGAGEILQGSRLPEGIFILSWPDSPFFAIMNGEPALTLIPNLLVSGICAACFSLAYVISACQYGQGKNTGGRLMLLTIPMLLTGAGLFPPVLGFLLGAAARNRGTAPGWWVNMLPTRGHILLSRIWPALTGLCAVIWLVMSPGLNIAAHVFGQSQAAAELLLLVLPCALISLLAAILSGFSHDAFPTKRMTV